MSEAYGAIQAPLETPQDAGTDVAPDVTFATRGAFIDILDRLGISLVAAAQPNKIILIGALGGRLTTTTKLVANPMGLAVDGGRLAVATDHSILVFANVPRLAARYPRRPDFYDAYYVPRTIHLTGECRTHDITFARHAIIAANTTFSCICRIDGAYHFTPLWRPAFVSELRPEDRCHLNGFTGESLELSYVTALAASDVPWGWREHKYTGGVLIDARRNVILRSDLCMPHSPRLVGDALFVLNGGEGEVLRIDRETGGTLTKTSLPAFTHGLCHHAGILFVGMSLNRISRTDDLALPVSSRFASLVAGIAAVDVRTGAILGAVEFDGVSEIFDVQVLPGVRRVGLQSLVAGDDHDGIETPEGAYWMKRPQNTAEAAATGNYQITLDIKV